jgi:hypothetical protein
VVTIGNPFRSACKVKSRENEVKSRGNKAKSREN